MLVAVLPPDVADKIIKIGSRLGFDFEGEAAAAAAAGTRLLSAHGLSWLDVLRRALLPPPPPRKAEGPPRGDRELAAWLHARAHMLDAREREFVASMIGWKGALSVRQRDWLRAIGERVARAAGGAR